MHKMTINLPTDELVKLAAAGASLDLREISLPADDWARIANAMAGKSGARLKMKGTFPTTTLARIAAAGRGCVEFS
jgi:hypothetical protein